MNKDTKACTSEDKKDKAIEDGFTRFCRQGKVTFWMDPGKILTFTLFFPNNLLLTLPSSTVNVIRKFYH